MLGKLKPPPLKEQLDAAASGIKAGLFTLQELKMAVAGVQLGVIQNELWLRTRAAAPLLGIEPADLHLPAWVRQRQVVTSALACTEAKQGVITELIPLINQYRAGRYVHAWHARALAVCTLLKGSDSFERMRDSLDCSGRTLEARARFQNEIIRVTRPSRRSASIGLPLSPSNFFVGH